MCDAQIEKRLSRRLPPFAFTAQYNQYGISIGEQPENSSEYVLWRTNQSMAPQPIAVSSIFGRSLTKTHLLQGIDFLP
jgi:hypothetical protein